jgi:hypothetical protein
LTGQLPFQAEDAMALVHCHLAKMPVPPCELLSPPPTHCSNVCKRHFFQGSVSHRTSCSNGSQCSYPISASAFESTKQESFAAGCHDFLVKPVQFEDLLECVGRYLGLEWLYEETINRGP